MNEQKFQPHYHQGAAHFDILAWLDTIPLSRPVRNLDHDFSDGILVAEIVAYFFPEYVDLDMFHVAKNMTQRTKNWRLLISNVLPKLNLHSSGTVVHDITIGDTRAVELFLLYLREKLEEHLIDTGRKYRLHLETWRSYNVERHHLPQLLRTPRRLRVLPGYGSFRSPRYIDSCRYEDALRASEIEIDALIGELKRCENVIRAKDKKIQELKDRLEKSESK